MRIEQCVENKTGKVTVYVEDDTVRVTDREAVRELIQVLKAAVNDGAELSPLSGRTRPLGMTGCGGANVTSSSAPGSTSGGPWWGIGDRSLS